MDVAIPRPTNRFLVRQRDRRWAQALVSILLIAVGLLLALTLIGWPRLRRISVHYDLIQLQAEVHHLEHRERELILHLQEWQDPTALSLRATALGLEQPHPARAGTAIIPSGAP